VPLIADDGRGGARLEGLAANGEDEQKVKVNSSRTKGKGEGEGRER